MARGSRLLDVGSGAGLPGVPLLVTEPRWHGVLLEPRQKRWAFLRLVIRELDLDAEALDCRYEELAGAARFDLITARAVGGYPALLRWARDRTEPAGGVALWTTDSGVGGIEREGGWRVLSWPLAGLDRGRLVYLQLEKIEAAGQD